MFAIAHKALVELWSNKSLIHIQYRREMKRSVMFVAALLALVFGVFVWSNVAKADEWTVRPGDSLWGIANEFNRGMSYPELMSANNLTNTSILHAGQKLQIPASWAHQLKFFKDNELEAIAGNLGYSNRELIVSQSGQTYQITKWAFLRFKNEAGWVPFGLSKEQQDIYPTEIIMPKGISVTLYPLGLTWTGSQLFAQKPSTWNLGEIGWSIPSYGLYTKPITLPLMSKEQWSETGSPWIQFVWQSSFYNSRTRTFYWWWFLPQLADKNIVLKIIDMHVTQIEPAEKPVNIGTKYVLSGTKPQDAQSQFVAGEVVTLSNYLEHFDYVGQSGSSPWRLLYPLFNGVELTAKSGKIMTFTSYYDLSIEDNNMSGMLADPTWVGRHLWVNHFVSSDWIPLSTANPAPMPTSQQYDKFMERFSNGQLVISIGVISDSVAINNYSVARLNNGHLTALTTYWTPPVGRIVVDVQYSDEYRTKLPDYAGKTMALFEIHGDLTRLNSEPSALFDALKASNAKVWYWNSEVEDKK